MNRCVWHMAMNLYRDTYSNSVPCVDNRSEHCSRFSCAMSTAEHESCPRATSIEDRIPDDKSGFPTSPARVDYVFYQPIQVSGC